MKTRKITTKIVEKAFALTICCYCFPPSSSVGQDIHFSQFYQTPLIINPALTGLFNGDQRVLINYKDQWGSVIENPYKTYALSYDMALFKNQWKNGFLGAGFYFLKDKAGKAGLGITQFNLSLSSIISIGENHQISAGLQGGFAQKSINYSDLKWGNQFDGNAYNSSLSSGEPNISNASSFGDFSAGISWSYFTYESNISSNNQFMTNVGVALYHVNKPKQEFYEFNAEKLYYRLAFHGGANIGIKNRNTAIVPSILLLLQGPSIEINFGTMIRYQLKEESRYTGFRKGSAVLFGGYYRVGDAFIPSFMFELANFALGISYDVNVSGLTKASSGRGGVEISLRYINPNPFQYGKGTKGTPML